MDRSPVRPIQEATGRKILALLHEAGEDDLAAVVNALTNRGAAGIELSVICQAVRNLIDSDLTLIERIDKRDVSKRLALSRGDSIQVVNALPWLVRWSPADRL